jgi:hypothetical protein
MRQPAEIAQGAAAFGLTLERCLPRRGKSMSDALVMVMGVLTFAVTAAIFWYCLPRGGRVYRFADTEWEPYIGVAFCSGIALSFTMILSSAINMFGQ